MERHKYERTYYLGKDTCGRLEWLAKRTGVDERTLVRMAIELCVQSMCEIATDFEGGAIRGTRQ